MAARTEDRSPPPRISDLPDYGLRCVDAAPACSRYDAAVGGRLRANPAAAAWIAENYGEHWSGDWFHVPIAVMQQAFTTEELEGGRFRIGRRRQRLRFIRQRGPS